MNKKGIICIIILMVQAIYIGCNSNHSSNSDSGTEEQWVTVSGKVVYLDDPQSALVLVNGQSMITNSDDGIFEIEALLDETGTLTLNVFVSGMAPYKQTVRPPETTDLIVSMSQPATDSSEMSLIAEIWPVDGDKVKIEGNVSFGGLPLHAMVIANGQHVFSNSENGSFRMVVMPTEEYEQIRIMCFSDGFIPYEETILPVKIEVVAHATSYGTVELSGTTQTIRLHQVSFCDFDHCYTSSYVAKAPIGATIDADDYQSVSDESDGTFEIEIPYDSSETIIIFASILEGIHYGAVIAPEEVIPWQYLSVSPAEMDLLLDTTEIAYIEGGQAPFQVSSTNPSIATASIQGRIVTIAGLSEGDATVAITDSESFVVQIAISVSSKGIGQAVWVPVKEEKDIGGNGVVNQVTYYTYDSNGLLREMEDYDNDGEIDWIKYCSCDEDGLRCTLSFDYTNNGIVGGYQYLTYDIEGRLVRREDENTFFHYSYNDQGKMSVFKLDHSKDDIIDYLSYINYDLSGYKIRVEDDEDADGIIDIVSTYENIYDDDGNLIQCEFDAFNDGTIQRVGFFEHKGDGTLSEFSLDFDNDGYIDRTVYFGPNNRVDHTEQFLEWKYSYTWELRYFNHRLNIPDLLEFWVWDQL